MQEEIADAAAGTPLGLSAEEVKALLAEAVKLEKTTLGTERHRQFTPTSRQRHL